jgi:uncharacterized protein
MMMNVADPTIHQDPESDRIVDAHAQEWERTYAMFTHLSLLAFHIAMPVIPALVMWLIKREKSPFIDDHGREAINFQISLVIYYLVGALLTMICVGIPVLIATYVLGIVGMILASIAANKGQYYRYPATIRFLN